MRVLVLLVVMVLIASFPFISDWVAKNKNSVTYGKDYINDVIKSYIEENPEYIMSTLHKYSITKEEEARYAFMKAAIKENKEKLHDQSYPSVGNSETVRIVEFFDYGCTHCKRVVSEVQSIIENKGDNIQYIFREIPMLSNGSEIAALAALAVNMVDKSKYFDFHKKLLAHKGSYNETVIKEFVEKSGIDLDTFEKAWMGAEVTQLLKDSAELFQVLGIVGAPAFIVCDEPIIGTDIDSLKKAIDECNTTTK